MPPEQVLGEIDNLGRASDVRTRDPLRKTDRQADRTSRMMRERVSFRMASVA